MVVFTMIGTSDTSFAPKTMQGAASTKEAQAVVRSPLKMRASSMDDDNDIKLLETHMPKALDYLKHALQEKDPNISEAALGVIDRLKEKISHEGFSDDLLALYDDFDEKLTSYNISLTGLADALICEEKAPSEAKGDERTYFNDIIQKASLKTKDRKLSWVFGLATRLMDKGASDAGVTSDHREGLVQLLRTKPGSEGYAVAKEVLEQQAFSSRAMLMKQKDPATGRAYLTAEEANSLSAREIAEKIVKIYDTKEDKTPKADIQKDIQFFMTGFIDYVMKYVKDSAKTLQDKASSYPDLFNAEEIENFDKLLDVCDQYLARGETTAEGVKNIFARTIKSPFLDQLKEHFFDRFIPLWQLDDPSSLDNMSEYIPSLEKRITSVAEYFRDHRKELLKLHDSDPKKLHDFIYSEGDYAEDVNKQYGATGLLEIIRDQEEGTTYAADAKVLKDQNAVAKAQAAFNALFEDEPEEHSHQPKNKGKKKKKSSKKGKSQKTSVDILQDFDPDNAYDTLTHHTPLSIEQLVTQFQHKHSILDLGQSDYDTAKGHNRPHSHGKAYYKVKSFLTNPNGRTTISSGGKAITNTQQFRTIKFFPTKQAKSDGTDPSPTLTHIQERHPDVFEFASGGSPMEKVKNLLRQVLDNVSEENIETSDHFITPDRQKKTVKAIKFTADVKFNGVTRKATCVFSKPPWDEQMNGLVMRTAYLHDEGK